MSSVNVIYRDFFTILCKITYNIYYIIYHNLINISIIKRNLNYLYFKLLLTFYANLCPVNYLYTRI